MLPRIRRYGLVLLLVLSAVGCSSTDPDGRLDLMFHGSGSGRVVGLGINCTTNCTALYSRRETVDLTATAASGSTFVAWGERCTGTSTTTQVTVPLDSQVGCVVTFDLLPPPPPPPPPPPGSVPIEDDFTAASPWTTIVLQTTGNPVDPQTAGTVATGGNLGAYRAMTHKFTGMGDIWVNHIYTGASYNPSSQGAITAVDFSEDRIIINGPFAGAEVADWFILTQNGQTFEKALSPNTFGNTSWGTVTLTGLHAGDFLPGPGPNFTATGGPIQFGYRRANTNASAVGYTITHGIDNWRVVIHR